jgi:hypothetical protein
MFGFTFLTSPLSSRCWSSRCSGRVEPVPSRMVCSCAQVVPVNQVSICRCLGPSIVVSQWVWVWGVFECLSDLGEDSGAEVGVVPDPVVDGDVDHAGIVVDDLLREDVDRVVVILVGGGVPQHGPTIPGE